MATSTQQINDLIQAGNDWKARADALLADRLTHQQAYEALSSDLRRPSTPTTLRRPTLTAARLRRSGQLSTQRPPVRWWCCRCWQGKRIQ